MKKFKKGIIKHNTKIYKIVIFKQKSLYYSVNFFFIDSNECKFLSFWSYRQKGEDLYFYFKNKNLLPFVIDIKGFSIIKQKGKKIIYKKNINNEK